MILDHNNLLMRHFQGFPVMKKLNLTNILHLSDEFR